MGLLARGMTFLNAALGTEAGVAVLYTRGVLTGSLTVVPGRTQADETLAPTAGTRLTDRERDYLATYAHLVTAGFGEPAKGDRITEVINGVSTVFTVADGERGTCWEFSDHTRTRARIHTRKA